MKPRVLCQSSTITEGKFSSPTQSLFSGVPRRLNMSQRLRRGTSNLSVPAATNSSREPTQTDDSMAEGRPLVEGSSAVEMDEMEFGVPEQQRTVNSGRSGYGRSGPRSQHAPLKVAGLELQPELLAISLVYCTQGLLGLSRLAVYVFLKNELALNPATVGLITSLSYAPWMIKPLYGFASDLLPLGGYRRRSYLLLCGLLGATAWAGMATFVHSPSAVIVALLLSSAATACSDVVADSVVVAMSRGESQSSAGKLQSLCWACASGGGVLSAYFSGSLVESYGTRPVFWLTGGISLLVMAAAFAIPEQRVTAGSVRTPALRPQVEALWATIKQRAILLPTLFIFIWQATPSCDSAMLFFEQEKLGFSTEFLGRIKLVSSIASLAGVGIFNYCLRDVPPRKMFGWTAGLGAALGLTQLMLITGVNQRLGLSNELFALGDSALLTVLAQVSFMPILVLAARICPQNLEASTFSTIMSITNAGALSGSALGSVLTDWFGVSSNNFDKLALLSAVCTLSSLLPLPLLGLLPDGTEQDAAKKAEGDHKTS